MAGELVEHVVEKSVSGGDLGAGPVEVERHLHVGLVRLATDLGSAATGTGRRAGGL